MATIYVTIQPARAKRVTAVPRRSFLLSSQVGSHKGGYFSFQPLWDWITEAEPDLFN
jgi:hypothetical protein